MLTSILTGDLLNKSDLKHSVRQFYDEVGWQKMNGYAYQNTQFEDLRPVSHTYIHRCHLRVNRHLQPRGRFLLDAGSGPVQYEEYLSYSKDYQYRVCLDISFRALIEAREKLGDHGLYVHADISHLPFKVDVFDGIVSLHALHHLPIDDQIASYLEFQRTMKHGVSAVVVNGWKQSRFMRKFLRPILLMERLLNIRKNLSDLPTSCGDVTQINPRIAETPERTFVDELDAERLKFLLKGKCNFEIHVWRSVNVRFLRALIHTWLGGRIWLQLIYWLEEINPHYFGEQGAYPLVVIRK